MSLSVELQCLLQSFFSQNALTEINLRAVIAELLHEGKRDEVSRAIINDTITEINTDISELDFEIRRTCRQTDGREIWVLCNTTSDQMTQLATVHTPSEVAYFRILLNSMFVANNTLRAEILAIANMDALRAAGPTTLSKAQAENALKQFVAEAWLQKSENGFYSLTARSLMELQGYLKDTFNDHVDGDEVDAIKSCYACKDFITMGYRCPDLNCGCRLHFYCYEGFFKGSMRCPVCRRAEWHLNLVNHVGEKAARQHAHDTQGAESEADEDAPESEIEET